MDNVCKCISCEAVDCKYNKDCNCVRDSIKVGCCCGGENCTCCESFENR